MTTIPDCDTRIDDGDRSYEASCACGWKRTVPYGRKAAAQTSQDGAYSQALALVRLHLPAVTAPVVRDRQQHTNPGCGCWPTPEHQRVTYGGATEPDSAWEYNPDCPEHGER